MFYGFAVVMAKTGILMALPEEKTFQETNGLQQA